MKIVFVSNVYPPHYLGGYEMQCKRVADELKARGHEVFVLTSTYKLGMMKFENNVFRTLSLSHPWRDDINCELFNDSGIAIYNYKLSKVIYHALKPDIIFFWSPLFISLAPIMAAQHLNIPRSFYISDNSLFRYQSIDCEPWTVPLRKLYWRLPFRVSTNYQYLTPLTDTIDWDPVMCCSHFIADHVKSHDIKLKNVSVIHHGIDPGRIPCKKKYTIKKHLNILYFGQIVEHKGVHTLIEAIAKYQKRYSKNIKLKVDLIGPSAGNFKQKLADMIEQYNLKNIVNMNGQLSNTKLLNSLADYDINIFPSEWEEPFSIGLLEAMGAGLPVISTATGGSREIVKDNYNVLLFNEGDPDMLSKRIHRMANMSENKRRKIGENARQLIIDKFSFDQMCTKIENVLLGILQNQPKHLRQR